MTLQEIKEAVDTGKVVHWSNEGYRVVYKYLIEHKNGHCIGLIHADGITLNGTEDQFYIPQDKENQ